ncbi:WXG100 family type VII secretion target [Streptoalloteichus hindustanus]|uniref:Proteins of 100 residues with WXG n=1 Tax=Streptoalloteichus hindustanus TaxID=2017 RepID=A0A1M5MTW6_STRHI|nr:WXG100 family type VII secretion target [Streptoalloteichus hindustanus]SHG80233.1 Proteins of 100 residues with WXG [Streptoalloteichus hindustanus]
MVVEVTDENQWRGSGLFEAYHGLVQSITQDAESETVQVLDITFNAIGAAAMTVKFAVDPIGTLLAAGVGWLIEHVSFLREPLDALMGDPDEIQQNTEALKNQAKEVRAVADDHKRAMASFDGWTGQSADAFRATMNKYGEELDSLAETVEGTAKVAAVTGVLVVVLRDIVRDIIAEVIAQLIKGALIALAAAAFTFGASIAGFIGFAVGKCAAVAADIASRIARLTAAFGRQGGRLAKLGESMGKLRTGFERFDNVADVGEVGHEMAKAGDAYKNAP